MTHSIFLPAISIPPNRQRRTFDEGKLAELAKSIADRGLIHAPVVRPEPNGGYTLVAGERRLRALRTLIDSGIDFMHNATLFKADAGCVPVTYLHEMPDDDRFEVELQENILRVDLSWQDRCDAIAELHRRRVATNPAHTKGATAAELANASGQAVSTEVKTLQRALVVAKHRDNPKVAAARDEREAYKIATAQMLADFNSDLAGQLATTPSPHTLILGDCQDVLPTLPAGQFDLILSDPPYAMGADSFGTGGPAHSYADGADQIVVSMAIISEGFRITKTGAHLYLFCDIDHFHALRAAASAAGWAPFRTPIVYDKGAGQGHNPIPNLAIRRTYELILFAVKGDRPGLNLLPDVISGGNGRPSTPEHAASKPTWLYEVLIRHSCSAGAEILDPCAGSGTIFTAAKALSCRATGVEKDPDHAALARGRM